MTILTQSEYDFILRRDFVSFIERSFYELNPQTRLFSAPYIEIIAAKLEACRRGEIKRLIICLPPRHLKSHCASIAFPAWILGHDPSAHLINASYGQDLAEKFARDCRTVMNSTWYRRLFVTRLLDRQPVHDFMTTESGTRMATSVGGVLTGRGADIIVIDDALKPDEALSETRRPAVNDWYNNTLLSRLNDKQLGCIVIIMQRLHQDDLVGHVLRQEPWEVVSFPAIAEEDERFSIEGPLGGRSFTRSKGDVLHPERESRTTLAHIRETIGDYNFASQYQQNPTPFGGSMVKSEWLKYYEPGECPVRFSRIVQSWDTANKANELADYSACTTWGVLGRTYYLLDVCRERLNYPDLRRAIIELARRWHAQNVVIEDKASGTQVIEDLKREGLIAVTPYTPPPGSDKRMRLHTQTAVFENGRVILPSKAAWLDCYVSELTGFPGTRYDDQVDSTSQALDYLSQAHGAESWAAFGRSTHLENFSNYTLGSRRRF